jgi:hypothetical protein
MIALIRRHASCGSNARGTRLQAPDHAAGGEDETRERVREEDCRAAALGGRSRACGVSAFRCRPHRYKHRWSAITDVTHSTLYFYFNCEQDVRAFQAKFATNMGPGFDNAVANHSYMAQPTS